MLYKKWWNYKTITILSIVIILLLFIIYRNNLVNYPSSTFRNIIEIIYFTSSSLLLIVAIVGLKQLSISKETSRINARRESYKLAAEQCTYFLQYIIPKFNVTDKYKYEHKIDSFGDAIIEEEDDRIIIKSKFNYSDEEKIMPIIEHIVDTLNSMEGFSLFFTSGVAEESIAFNSIGYTFCNNIKEFLPIIALGKGNGFRNIILLYHSWSNQLETKQALRDKIESEKKILNTKVVRFKSIGS